MKMKIVKFIIIFFKKIKEVTEIKGYDDIRYGCKRFTGGKKGGRKRMQQGVYLGLGSRAFRLLRK